MSDDYKVMCINYTITTVTQQLVDLANLIIVLWLSLFTIFRQLLQVHSLP